MRAKRKSEVPLQSKLAVTVPEAAELLSVGATTIYNLIASGDLRSTLIGRSRRITTASINSFLAGRPQQ